MINIINKYYYINLYLDIKYIFYSWGLGIWDWGLGIGPNPQSPIPNNFEKINKNIFY